MQKAKMQEFEKGTLAVESYIQYAQTRVCRTDRTCIFNRKHPSSSSIWRTRATFDNVSLLVKMIAR